MEDYIAGFNEGTKGNEMNRKFVEEKANRLADRMCAADPNSNPTIGVHPCKNENGQWMVAVDFFADDGEGGYVQDRQIVGWV